MFCLGEYFLFLLVIAQITFCRYRDTRRVRWLVSGLAGAGLLWEENIVGWLNKSGWNQQANRVNIYDAFVNQIF